MLALLATPAFPVSEYWWLYLAFTGLIAGLLAIDLRLHRDERAVSLREAGLWTAIWISLALIFSGLLYWFLSVTHSPAVGHQLTLEFLAGYVVEEALSIDNMFVFALIFRYFAIPSRFQHRVLFYGVLGAMVFRAIFIAVGAALIRFEWVMIVFGLFLIYTGIRMAFEQEKEIDPGSSPLVRWVSRFLPATPQLHGSRFFVHVDGKRHITPLLIVLLLLETTDIMFAVDSVPAVFGVTHEPFIVFTSNVFAILGLRSMFFLLSGALDRFYLLKHGLSVVLVFVGLKMVWLDHLFGGRFPIAASLAIITLVIAASIGLSLLFPKSAENSRTAARFLGNVIRPAAGVSFLLLAIACVLYAVGWGQQLLPLPALEQLNSTPLYWSAACYVVCAVVLLRRTVVKNG